MTDTSTQVIPGMEMRTRTRAPRLANVTDEGWTAIRILSYRFARQVRHDIVNLQTGMQMLEAVEQIVEAGGADDLPPDADLKQLRESASMDFHRTVQMASVASFLTHSGNPEAYAPTRCQPLAEIMELGVTSYLPAGHPCAAPIIEMCGNIELVTMGDLLPMAINTCFFQWAPLLHDPVRASQATVRCDGHQVTLRIAADDSEGVKQFHLHADAELSPLAREVAAGNARLPTTELALLNARHIVEVHGGTLEVDFNDAGPVMVMTLPLPQGTCFRCPNCARGKTKCRDC